MTFEDRLREVQSRIARACRRAGREPNAVTLVAATKGVSLDAVRRARGAGVVDFAENYASEMVAKAPHVPATWHFVGKLQRGTAAKVAGLADVVHSAEPGRALERVAMRAHADGREIAWLAQVDFTGRRQGVGPLDLEEFLRKASRLPGIRLTGLMTLPPMTSEGEQARRYFIRLRELRNGLRTAFPALVELSMGMSADYEVAVEEGATMVRIGSALFGERSAAGAPGRPMGHHGEGA
jgi:pyridoxal phosphate enzyme (YggS family)